MFGESRSVDDVGKVWTDEDGAVFEPRLLCWMRRRFPQTIRCEVSLGACEHSYIHYFRGITVFLRTEWFS